MNSTTRTRKTTRPMSARLATSLPQLAPISVCEMSSRRRRRSSSSDRVAGPARSRRWSSGSVWTRMRLVARGVTTGEAARRCRCRRPPRAARRPLSWVTWSAGRRDLVLGAAVELDAEVEALEVQARRRQTHDDQPRDGVPEPRACRRSRSRRRRRRGRCRAGRTCPSGPPSTLRRAARSMPRVSASSPDSLWPWLKNLKRRQPRHHRLGEPEEHRQVDQRARGRARTRSPSPRRRRRCRAPRRRATRRRRRPDRCSGRAPSRSRPRPASTCRRASRLGFVRSRR